MYSKGIDSFLDQYNVDGTMVEDILPAEPVEQLSRENIREKLIAHDVDDVTIQKFTSALDE